jgi:hypothetical protein
MVGPGHDVPVQDPSGISRNGFGQESPGRGDQLEGPIGGLSNQGGRDREFHPTELAVEGGEGCDLVELAFQEGGTRRRPKATGDIGHDLDEMAQEELAGVLGPGHVIEDGVDGRRFDHPIQSDPCHDSRSSPFGKRIEDGRQDHGTSLGERANPFRSRRL